MAKRPFTVFSALWRQRSLKLAISNYSPALPRPLLFLYSRRAAITAMRQHQLHLPRDLSTHRLLLYNAQVHRHGRQHTIIWQVNPMFSITVPHEEASSCIKPSHIAKGGSPACKQANYGLDLRVTSPGIQFKHPGAWLLRHRHQESVSGQPLWRTMQVQAVSNGGEGGNAVLSLEVYDLMILQHV